MDTQSETTLIPAVESFLGPKDDALRQSVSATEAEASLFDVVDHASFEEAGRRRERIASVLKAIAARFMPIQEQAHRLHKAICSMHADFRSPAERADAVYREKQRLWKLQEREQERQRQIEAQRQAEERQLAAATIAEAQGFTEEAEAILEMPIAAPPIQSQRSETTVAPRVWKFEVVDVSKINPAYLVTEPDLKKIKRVVAALGPEAQQNIGAGVRIYEDIEIRRKGQRG